VSSDGQPCTAHAIAATDCELVAIERFPRLSLRSLSSSGAPGCGLRAPEWRRLVLLNLPTRPARLLLRLLEEKAAAMYKNKLSITQQESGILGTSLESVN
jgi:hypothetical protein